MADGLGEVYRDDVALENTALRALWSTRSRRATGHALAGLAVGVICGLVFALLFIIWFAAIYSLAEGPTGDPVLAWVYGAAVAAGPVVFLWWVQGCTALQRARFRTVLGVEIPAAADPGPMRPIRAWRSSATWRQFGYHLLAPVIGAVGGGAVVLCWSAAGLVLVFTGGVWRLGLIVPALALLPAAPWVARGVTRVDRALARTLLGPGRSEALARRVETLTRSRADLVAAADAERRRIERDLHDGAQQRLVSLALNLGMARVNLADAPEPARKVIESAHDEATQALTELRDLVRGLHPPVLEDRGLDAALSGIAARSPVPARLRVDLAQRCSPSVEAIAYFVVAEALTNVAKHACAEQADVRVTRIGDRLHVAVTDDGQGGADLDGSGSGLRGLVQRVGSVDGTLTIHSPPGGPTTIAVELPCES
jgi:signal transduction histidine kinase